MSHRHLVTKPLLGVSFILQKESLKEGQSLHKSRVYCQHIRSIAPKLNADEGTRNGVVLSNAISDGGTTDAIIVLHNIRFKICR